MGASKTVGPRYTTRAYYNPHDRNSLEAQKNEAEERGLVSLEPYSS